MQRSGVLHRRIGEHFSCGLPGCYRRARDDMPDLIVCLSGVYDFADLVHLQTPCVLGETCFWEGFINYLGCRTS